MTEPGGAAKPRTVNIRTARTISRHALVGQQLATEEILRRLLQAVVAYLPPQARPELLRAMRAAVDQSAASTDLGEAAATEEARHAAGLVVSAVFDPVQAEVAMSGAKPPGRLS